MSLLTPSESHLLQSFLTSVDAQDFELEWNMHLDVPQNNTLPPAHTPNNPLVKATKDLLSLDNTDKLRYQSAHRFTSPLREAAVPGTRQIQQQPNPLSFLYSTRRTQCLPDQSQGPSYRRASSSSSGYSPLEPPVSSSSSPLDTPTLTPTTCTKRASPVDSRPSNKRARQDGQSVSRRAKAGEPSTSSSPSSSSRASTSALSTSKSTSTVTPKPTTLLSPSQKKANHIQSEQKRRANIRRGYEALCETVPALREAIQAEEEESAKATKGKRRLRGKAAAAAASAAEDCEKIDGRAGPRSENVVLSKTIEYITDLLAERESLLHRLQAARSVLPPNHFALLPQTGGVVPLWERKWTGGENKEEEEEEEEEDD